MPKQAKPAASTRSPGLDLLRSIAILLVVLWHIPRANLPAVLHPVRKIGWTGVDLFFVLSGYLIGSQLLRTYAEGRTPSFRNFYFRRSMRVLPAYLVVLALYFVFPFFREQPDISPLWRFLTFTQNFGLKLYSSGAFSHVWSLCVEEHFYLLLPIIVFALMRRPRLVISASLVVAILLCCLALRWALWDRYLAPISSSPDTQEFVGLYLEKIYYPTYTRLDGLVVGVVIAATRIFRPRWWNYLAWNGNVLSAAGIALLLLSYPICRNLASLSTALFGYPLLALGFGFLVVASVCGNGILAKSHVWGSATVATLAYSTYLTHKQVFHLDRVLFANVLNMESAAGTVLYLVSIAGAASLLYLGVERPFLLARDTITKKEKEIAYAAACE